MGRRTRRGVDEAADQIPGMRKELLVAARRTETVTYGRLMREFHLSRGLRFARTLGSLDLAERRRGAPGFAAIVVRKDTGYPGGGYFCDDELPRSLRRPAGRSTDPRLSTAEKDHVKRRQREVWAYYAGPLPLDPEL